MAHTLLALSLLGQSWTLCAAGSLCCCPCGISSGDQHGPVLYSTFTEVFTAEDVSLQGWLSGTFRAWVQAGFRGVAFNDSMDAHVVQ